MGKIGKKHKKALQMYEDATVNSWMDALTFVVNNSYAGFDESVDVDIVLGIDPTKGEQSVRGSTLLPHGTGKSVRVVAFVKGENEDIAKDAGADFVGSDDLIKKIQDGWLDFDVAVATPDLMGLVGKVAKILGPRGLLPNKKVGTVTFGVADIVRDLKQGRLSFKNDKGGGLHISFGKISFGAEKLYQNLTALVKAVVASKPPSSKGKFIKKVSVSSTMGVGVVIGSEAQ